MHVRRLRKTGDPGPVGKLADLPARACSVADCARKVKGRGLCEAHYMRLYLYGDVRADVPLRSKSGGPCSVEGCPEPSRTRDLCRLHYLRVRRSGDAGSVHRGRAAPHPMSMSPIDRVLADLDRSGGVDACWPYIGRETDTSGYARVRMPDGSRDGMHRVIHRAFIGPIPAGFHVDHMCHNDDPNCLGNEECPHRSCGNPYHLQAVPPRVNKLRSLHRTNEIS